MRENPKYVVVVLNSISLILLLIGEICFYKSETIILYELMTGTGIIVAFLNNLKRFTLKIRLDNFILWLTIVYGMYFVYGLCYLQRGEFPLATLFYRYIEAISLFLVVSALLVNNICAIEKSFSVAGIVSMIYLVLSERANIILGATRIGNTLSGNVNTAGFNFGIISMIVMWSYCRQKKWYKIVLFVLLAALMLITGSKKTLIILVIDLIMLFVYERKQLGGWMKLLLVLVLSCYIIFNVPYFYNIIGMRVESMIETLISGSSSTLYSYSTEVRDEMILEAFNLFLHKPIIGGGWNYFYSKTVYGYEYSHCNYVEMLCSFGLIGTSLFYSKHFSCIKQLIKKRRLVKGNNRDLLIIASLFVIAALIIDWGAVTFSAQCVWYLPVVFSSAAIFAIRYNEKNQRED